MSYIGAWGEVGSHGPGCGHVRRDGIWIVIDQAGPMESAGIFEAEDAEKELR